MLLQLNFANLLNVLLKKKDMIPLHADNSHILFCVFCPGHNFKPVKMLGCGFAYLNLWWKCLAYKIRLLQTLSSNNYRNINYI